MSQELPASGLRRSLPDVLACLVLLLASALVFGRRSGLLGFNADDPGFLNLVHPGMSLREIFGVAMNYVTGRNLHMVWQYIVTVAAGGAQVENLGAMHHIQALGDCVNGALLFVVLRAWGFRRVGAFAGAIAFALFPNHGETHFWLSALPMNVVSTFFVLLLLLALARLVDAVRQGDRPRAAVAAALLGTAFLCAMFTYDQVVPAVVSAVCVVLLYVAWHRPFRAPAVLGLACVLAVFAGLVVWKLSDPAGGPALSRLSIEQLLANVKLSVKIWLLAFEFPLDTSGIGGLQAHAPAGSSLSTLLFPMQVLASPGDRTIAAALAAIVAATVYWLARREAPVPQGDSRERGLSLPAPALLALGIAFFLLAYLPGYIWYISPRHSYLPSVGVAAILAALICAIPGRLLRGRAVAAGLAAFMAVQVAGYCLVNQVEKESWIESFAVRKQIYEELGRKYAGPNPTALLLAGFPAAPQPSGPALAFLTGEHPSAISIVTKGRVKAGSIALHPIPGREGYFVRTEETRWGDEAFTFLPKEAATVVVFKGREGGRLTFAYDASRTLLREDAFYSLVPVPEAKGGGEGRFTARPSGDGFELAVPPVALGAGEVLAVIACHTTAGERAPVFYQRPEDNERFLVPVEVPATGAALRLKYRLPLQGIDCFRLYKVGPEKPRLVGEAAVS